MTEEQIKARIHDRTVEHLITARNLCEKARNSDIFKSLPAEKKKKIIREHKRTGVALHYFDLWRKEIIKMNQNGEYKPNWRITEFKEILKQVEIDLEKVS